MTKEPRKWYVVCAVQDWTTLTVTTTLGAYRYKRTLKDMEEEEPGGPVGYLPVFDTREEAEAWGEGLPIITIQTSKEESDGTN